MLSRQHNNTNVLALGSRVIGPELARMIVKSWLEAEFEGGRHASRLEIISAIESGKQPPLQSAEHTSDDLRSQARRKIAETGRLVFERHLTDAAGGNISVRVGDSVCITPRYSGSKRHWQLHPDQVLVSDLSGNKLDGDGDVSRESKVHYRLYQEFPDATSVLHSHARNVMVFVPSANPSSPYWKPHLNLTPSQLPGLPPLIQRNWQTRSPTPRFEAKRSIRKYATAVIAPWHGLFVIGKDLDAAFDLTERIDTNAYCILMSRLLPEGGPIDQKIDPETMRKRLSEAIRTFNDHHANA
jgi:L-fuculose-phosphate aldolase